MNRDEPVGISEQQALYAYSIRDVATRLAVSERHIHRLLVRGELRSVRVGRRRVIPGAALAAWLAGKAA